MCYKIQNGRKKHFDIKFNAFLMFSVRSDPNELRPDGRDKEIVFTTTTAGDIFLFIIF